jgi:hypothetical protein
MEIWEMSKAEFFGHLEPMGHQDNWAAFAAEFSGLAGQGTPQPLPHTTTAVLYEIVNGNVIAYESTTGELCGVACGDVIAVKGDKRGMGIGAGLVKIGFQSNPWGPFTPRSVTEEGLRCLKRTHKLEVLEAIEANLPVPPNVRADYNL